MVKKLTLARIAAHDFNRALRVWKTRLTPAEIFKQLVSEQAKSLALTLRSVALAIVGTFWLAVNKSELSLKISFIDITIPVAYVNFAVAVLFFATLIHLINYFTLNQFVLIASDKLFKFDSAWALAVLHSGGPAWSMALVQQFRFLSSSSTHRRLGTTMALLINLPLLMILIVGYWTVSSVGVQVLRRDGLLSTAGAFTIVGWLLMLYPVALAILLRVPFKFHKEHIIYSLELSLANVSTRWKMATACR